MNDYAQNEKVLVVLAALARAGQALTVKELLRLTGLPQSSLYRQLGLLKKWGLVQEHAQTGLYEPGPLCLQLAWGYDQHSWLLQAVRPELEKLTQTTGESAGLLCYLQGQVICLDMQESQHALRCSFAKGRGTPLWRGASAKCLLAHLPAVELQQLWPLLDDAASQSKLQAEFALIRQQGYAISEHEVDQGVWGVSVAILNPQQQLLGGLSLMAPSARASLHAADWIKATQAAVERVQRRLRA